MWQEILDWIQLYSFILVLSAVVLFFVIRHLIIVMKERKKQKELEQDVPPMPPKSFYDMPLDIISNLKQQRERAVDELRKLLSESKKLAKDARDIKHDYEVQDRMFKQQDENLRKRYTVWFKYKEDLEKSIMMQQELEEKKPKVM